MKQVEVNIRRGMIRERKKDFMMIFCLINFLFLGEKKSKENR